MKNKIQQLKNSLGCLNSIVIDNLPDSIVEIHSNLIKSTSFLIEKLEYMQKANYIIIGSGGDNSNGGVIKVKFEFFINNFYTDLDSNERYYNLQDIYDLKIFNHYKPVDSCTNITVIRIEDDKEGN